MALPGNRVSQNALQRHVRGAQLGRAAAAVERVDAHDIERAQQPRGGAVSIGAGAEIQKRTLLERLDGRAAQRHRRPALGCRSIGRARGGKRRHHLGTEGARLAGGRGGELQAGRTFERIRERASAEHRQRHGERRQLRTSPEAMQTADEPQHDALSVPANEPFIAAGSRMIVAAAAVACDPGGATDESERPVDRRTPPSLRRWDERRVAPAS
jgi:hypothetical protein